MQPFTPIVGIVRSNRHTDALDEQLADKWHGRKYSHHEIAKQGQR